MYNTKKHAVYMLTYHMVFVTKYRKPVISDEIRDFMKRYAAEPCIGYGGKMISAETDRDHIHLLVSLPPDAAPVTIVNSLKTQLSKAVHANPDYMSFVSRYLFGKCPLWGASYFIATTGSVSMETVKAYIESQRTNTHRCKSSGAKQYRKKRTPH